MNKFHKKVLENINISVERISFRKDKWGEIATVYYAITHNVLGLVAVGDLKKYCSTYHKS